MKRRNFNIIPISLFASGLWAGFANSQNSNELTVSMHRDSGDKSYFTNFIEAYNIKMNVINFDNHFDHISDIYDKKVKPDAIITSIRYASMLYLFKLLQPINFKNIYGYSPPKQSIIGIYNQEETAFMYPIAQFSYIAAYNQAQMPQMPNHYANIFSASDNIIYWDESIAEDIVRLASKYLGYGYNNTDNLQQVIRFLQIIKKNIKFVANPQKYLLDNQASIIFTYSYKIAPLINKYNYIGYFYPQEGTATNEQVIVIHKESTNARLAEQLLSYLSLPLIQSKLLQNTHTTSQYPQYVKLLPLNFQNNRVIFPNFPEKYQNSPMNFVNIANEKLTKQAFKQVFG